VKERELLGADETVIMKLILKKYDKTAVRWNLQIQDRV
jgi:hypothetical protein